MNYDGFTIILTRPTGQAKTLRNLLLARGADVELRPLLEVNEIAPAGNTGKQWDDVIFVSPNAVKWGMRHMVSGHLERANVFAVGPSTAQALRTAGVKHVAAPTRHYNSEALVSDPRLADVHNHNIAIVRGREGRDYLKTALSRRGAKIELIDVYERHGAPITLSSWGQLKQPYIVTASSAAALNHLHTQILDQNCKALFAVPLVLSSPRMVKHAKALGFTKTWCGKDATDAGLIAAIDRCITDLSVH